MWSNVTAFVESCACTECNNDKDTFIEYTFSFSFGDNKHIFKRRYSKLYEWNKLLSKNAEYLRLFNNKPPKFPAKNWLTDYSKPQNYEKRATELVKYFRNLISKPSVLNIDLFQDGIGLTSKLKQQLNCWKCDACHCINTLNNKICKKCNAENIIIPIKICYKKPDYSLSQELKEKLNCWQCGCHGINELVTENCQNGFCGINRKDVNMEIAEQQLARYKNLNVFAMRISYSPLIKIIDIANKAILPHNKRAYPVNFIVDEIDKKSFNGNSSYLEQMTVFDIDDITTKGLTIKIDIKYVHQINASKITCEYIQKNDTDNDDEKKICDENNECSIYKKMKLDDEFSETNLNHLYEFTHFRNENREKEKCEFNEKCESFIRLNNGGNNVADQCHMKLYKHLPRKDRQIKLSKNVASFLCHRDEWKENIFMPPYQYASNYDAARCFFGWSMKNGYLRALVQEVLDNGFKSDLCTECTEDDECKHSISLSEDFEAKLNEIIDEKMNHIRHQYIDKHLRRDHILSLMLYTQSNSIYDLLNCQINGDYNKWKWFDRILYEAIYYLSKQEIGTYPLYLASNTRLDTKQISNGYFPTYISTSYDKDVVIGFMDNIKNGIMIEIDDKYRNDDEIICCDVSWISKFPDECEVVIARSIGDKQKMDKAVLMRLRYTYPNTFSIKVDDDINGIQNATLTFTDTTTE